MTKKTEAKRSENQTYFIIQVMRPSTSASFLSYNTWGNTFDLVENEQNAAQFNEEARATEVAQFFQKTAAMRGSDVTYKLFKKLLDTVEIPLPVVDWHKDHKVEIGEDTLEDDGVEIEE